MQAEAPKPDDGDDHNPLQDKDLWDVIEDLDREFDDEGIADLEEEIREMVEDYSINDQYLRTAIKLGTLGLVSGIAVVPVAKTDAFESVAQIGGVLFAAGSLGIIGCAIVKKIENRRGMRRYLDQNIE